MFSQTRFKKLMDKVKKVEEASTSKDILTLQTRIKTLEDTNKTLTAKVKALESKIIINPK
jgi:uncharacterized protein YqgV (UPF0045/DUF77 family)